MTGPEPVPESNRIYAVPSGRVRVPGFNPHNAINPGPVYRSRDLGATLNLILASLFFRIGIRYFRFFDYPVPLCRPRAGGIIHIVLSHQPGLGQRAICPTPGRSRALLGLGTRPGQGDRDNFFYRK
jgi:hypothetical protein